MTKDNDFKNYDIRPVESKSFHFTPDGRWCQSFVFTWVKGFFIMTGDMGELVLEHNCFEDFESGLHWILGSINNVRYFMEKATVSDFEQEFNAEKTVDNLIEILEQYKDDEDGFETYHSDGFCRLINEVAYTYFAGTESIEEYISVLKDSVGNITEENVCEHITDGFEQVVKSYPMERLQPRLDAIKEFAQKMLDMKVGV